MTAIDYSSMVYAALLAMVLMFGAKYFAAIAGDRWGRSAAAA